MRARLIDIGLLLASALPSGALVLYLIKHVSHELHVSTTTIGYPIYNDWNYGRYFSEYRLVIYAFPLLTAAVFLALTTLARRVGVYGASTVGGPVVLSANEVEAPRERSQARVLLHHVVRSAVVGGVLGAEVAIAQNATGAGFWWRLAAGAVILGAACALAPAFDRLRTGLGEKISLCLTGLGAVATLPGLAWIAATTTITVRAGGAIHTYNWFPLKIALPITFMAAAAVFGSLWLARVDPASLRRSADRSVIFLAVPVAVYLSYAFIPGESRTFNFYEDGQLLATVNFLSHGSLPYINFFSLHGLLYDGLQPLVGMSLLSQSFWGMKAGIYLIMFPLTLALLYAFAAGMYERAWPLAFLAIVVPGYLARPDAIYASLMTPFVRFMLWPVALILLKVALSRRAIGWSLLLGASLIVTAMLTPEGAYFIPAVGIAVVARDVYCRDQDWRLGSFKRTLGVTVGGAVTMVPILVFLLLTHSLGSFIEFYRLAATDHSLIAASPIMVDLHKPIIFFAAGAPVVATLLTMLWIGLRLRWRMPLIDLDWVMVAAAILTAVYYEKWLAIPDLHVLESYAAALPLIFAWGARILLVLDSAGNKTIRARIATAGSRLPFAIRALRPRSPVSAAVLAVALIALHAALLTGAPGTAQQYRTAVGANPQDPRLGYIAPGVVDEAQIKDIRTFLAAYMRPGEGIFDFSNTPGLYYYLLPYRPVTLTYELSGVSDQSDQEWLIAQLRRASPRFVVWNSLSSIGLPILGSVWNMARLYLVSQYILENYRPFAMVRGEVFYVKKSAVVRPPSSVPLNAPPVTQGLDFLTPCSWGYAPNFLSARPAPTAAPQAVETVPAASTATLRPPSGVAWSHFHWAQVSFSYPPPRDSFAIFDNQAPNHSMAFSTTGRGPSALWIPISACAQWHGYGSETLTITQTNPQPLTLRLVP